MSGNAGNTTRRPALPTLHDVESGKVSLDENEIAHGEDIPEWSDDDFAQARPMCEVAPEIVQAFERMRGQRGPQRTATKERIGLRLDPEVVAHFRGTGPGWQRRINDVLLNHVKGGR